MQNVNVEEVAKSIQDSMETDNPTNQMEFVKKELDELEVTAEEIRDAIIRAIDF